MSTSPLGLAALEVALPQALWALGFAIPIALFHLYHRRRVVVPHLPLLMEAVGPRRPGGGWRHLRDVTSLWLRVAALACAVLALAGLAPATAAPPPEAFFVVVDADVSALTREADGRTRYAHALDLARASLLAAPWAEATVIEARGTPRVLVPATRDSAAAARRLERFAGDVARGDLAAGPGRADLDAAVQAAVERAGARTPARVRVLTSRALEGGRAQEDVVVEAWGTGVSREDQGITVFDVTSDAPGVRTTVRLRVRNWADGERTRTVVLSVGDDEVLRRHLVLASGAEEEVAVDLVPPHDGAWLHAALVGEDAFDADDEVIAWLAPPARPSVLVIHDGAVRPYTQAILLALGEGIDVEASGRVSLDHLARARDRDVFLVDGVSLPPGALRPGAWLFLAPLGGALPFAVGEPVKEPLVWRSAPDHPLVRDIDLGSAWIARAFPVAAGEGALDSVSLAEADGRTVIGEGEKDGVRYVVMGLDPEGSDLPLRAALPLLVRNALRRLAATAARPLSPFYRAGDVFRPRLPLPGGPLATIRWGGREVRAPLDPEGDAFTVPPGARGPVEVTTGGDEEGGAVVVGRTAFVDLHPDLAIIPAHPLRAVPPPFCSRPAARERWRRALLAAAVLLLLVDLVLLGRLGRPARKKELALGVETA